MNRIATLTAAGAVLVVVALVAFFVVRVGAPAEPATGDVQAALAKQAAQLAGGGDAEALAAATCKATDTNGEFDCIPAGAPARQAMRVVLKDGTLTKRFSGAQPVRDPRTVAQVSEALPIDAAARGVRSGRFSCATSLRFLPDGSTDQGGASGMLCVRADDPAAGARYVEPAADGTIARDYAVEPTATP